MSWQALSTGIVALVNADTGSGGLRNASTPLINAIYSNEAPQDAALPYAVLILVSDVELKAFATSPRSLSYGVQFSVWTDRVNGVVAGQAIIDRIRAVCDRVAPTVTGFTASQLLRTGGQVIPEEETYHHVEEYDVHLGA